MRHSFNTSINTSIFGALGGAFMLMGAGALFANSAPAGHWESPAQLHRFWRKAFLRKPISGTLILDDSGVEFRSDKFSKRWPYAEIQTFDLSPRELTLTSYENRPWHEPGVRRFRFTFSESMPPEVASEFTARVGKPAINGVPAPKSVAIAEIPAHHRTWSRGSNGILRLRDDGIDYVTKDGRDSRSWRWADIQTIANSNPYELRITAYREIVEFDLKQPLPREIFERMWGRLYATGLNISTSGGQER